MKINGGHRLISFATTRNTLVLHLCAFHCLTSVSVEEYHSHGVHAVFQQKQSEDHASYFKKYVEKDPVHRPETAGSRENIKLPPKFHSNSEVERRRYQKRKINLYDLSVDINVSSRRNRYALDIRFFLSSSSYLQNRRRRHGISSWEFRFRGMH